MVSRISMVSRHRRTINTHKPHSLIACTFRKLSRWRVLQGVFFDYAAELRIGWRQLFTIDGRCGVRRTRHPGRLLGRCGNATHGEKACAQKNGAADFTCDDTDEPVSLLELVVSFSGRRSRPCGPNQFIGSVAKCQCCHRD
jgi:hypothetical protein